MSDQDFERLTNRLAAATIVMFALLGAAAAWPSWGCYAAGAWGGGMVLPLYRWYRAMIGAR